MHLIRRNILANYLGTIAMVFGPLLALPWYISILGPTQFGLICFVTTLQGFLTLLECGISQVSSREFSVRMGGSKRDFENAAQLLYSFEVIYWAASLTAGTIILILADVISHRWLLLDSQSSALGNEAIYGAAAIFAVQFPGALYRSFLASADKQIALNAIVVTGMSSRHIVGILLLTIWPSLLTYLLWQFVSVGIETIIRGHFAWRLVPARRRTFRWNYGKVRPVLMSGGKMFTAVILGPLTTQMDKIFLSRMVPIEQFGYYAIASTLAIGALQMIHPLVQAVSPRMMQSSADPIVLRRININLTLSISLVVLVTGLSYAVGGRIILEAWLKNSETVFVVYPLLSILLVGSALNAFYHVGYYNWLALDKTNIIFTVNLLSFILCLSVTPMLIHWNGVIGATFGFVIMNVVGLGISVTWLMKHAPARK